MLLKANDIAYNFKSVNATKGETRTAEFLAVCPTGQVPCIVDDKVGVLSEHGAILTYLCEQHKLSPWYPEDPVVRGRVQFWINWNHTNTRHGTMGVLIGNLYPDKFGSGLETATKKYTRAVKFMEKTLESGKFIAGTAEPTIADLSIVTELDQLNKDAFGFFDFTPYPKVSSWLNLVAKSVSSYKTVHDPVVEIAKFSKKP
jgi:glutathione S-transferase